MANAKKDARPHLTVRVPAKLMEWIDEQPARTRTDVVVAVLDAAKRRGWRIRGGGGPEVEEP